MPGVIHHIWYQIIGSLSMTFWMGWEMFWALVLGFTLSAIVQSWVSKSQINKWFADHSLKSLTAATLFGAASSSCSYAAAAVTRSLVKQEADFTSAMAFQFASTNLVLELGILLALLLGWQFTLAQFIGGIFMIAFMTLFFRLFLPKKVIAEAYTNAKKTVAGSAPDDGKLRISHYFIMDWTSLWSDILLGLLISGVLSTFVPDSFWTILFCKDNSTLAHIINPLIGPLIAILSFVCSIGNVPMAAVLWLQGMTFGGVLSFLFADLLAFPLLNIYRKYYGIKMASFLAISFYICMVAAAYACELLFSQFGLIPFNSQSMLNASTANDHHMMHHAGFVFNYTTVLNIIALVFTGLLCYDFYRNGGFKTLFAKRSDGSEHHHSCH